MAQQAERLAGTGVTADGCSVELPLELPSLGEFARRLATGPRRPSAGATAALAVGLACDLVTQVAERSAGWEEQRGILAQTAVLRERATSAAHDVAVGYHELVEALDAAVAGPLASHSATALGDRLASIADVLIRIAETACDCASLALTAARCGDTVVRGDAAAAAILASGAADIAAHLVEVNLLASVQQERTARARMLARAAADSRAAAVAILA